MARRMGDAGEAFRTRVRLRVGQVHDRTIHEGPYATVGAAKSRLTWAKRVYGDRIIEAVVERAMTNWEPVEL